ncbi:MAG: hypothetical protein BZY79_04805 [SAR202 cluster bacterium Casp-Chloro-G4]|nr:ArsR family transcriptional regulator [Chloroflexota bacterium]PKB61204.1 MAG: hypothetical protein BZY79_04805 [SAR202 cluster bacterium Casp-Chloro-G4]
MEGTRLRILQLLQANGHKTVDGLATSIGLAPATIRRHLDILQRDRLVGFEEVRKKTGRPEYSFYLTEDGQESLPKDYDRLLTRVVDQIGKLTPEDTQGLDGPQILHQVFTGLSQQTASENVSLEGQSLEQRAKSLFKVLESQDFSPILTKSDDVIELRLMNCPFRSVAMKNPSVCSYDFHLIATMLGVDISRMESIRDGAGGCMYKIMVTPDESRELAIGIER